MKTVIGSILALLLLVTGQSCTTSESRYVDLNTGTPFHLVKDPQTGLMVDAQTGKPLNIYIDKVAGDTVYGRTGKVINGEIAKLDDHYYTYIGVENGEAGQHIAGGKVVTHEGDSHLDKANAGGLKTVSNY